MAGFFEHRNGPFNCRKGWKLWTSWATIMFYFKKNSASWGYLVKLILNVVFSLFFVTAYKKKRRDFIGSCFLNTALSSLSLKTILSMSQVWLKISTSHFHKMCFVLPFYSVVSLFDIAAEQEVTQTVNKSHSSDHDDSVSLSFFQVPFTLLTWRNDCQCSTED
jgi:hypothetical protein